MFKIDNASAVASLPAPAAVGTPGYFTDGNPGTGTPATILPADFLNMVQQELMNVLAAASIAPSKTTYTQVRDAILAMIAAGARPTFTSDWVAGSTAFAASAVTSFPHGLTLDQIRSTVMQLECTSAELGFGVGARVQGFDLGGGGNDSAANSYHDETNIGFTMPSGQVVEVYAPTVAAANSAIDITKWRMRFLIN